MRRINPFPTGNPTWGTDIPPTQPVHLKFCTDVNNSTRGEFERIIEDFVERGAKDIRILISSAGGNVNAGIEMHNMLKSLPIDLTMHNIGSVESIANVVFLAGKKRYATPNARFMMHGVSRSYVPNRDGKVSLDEFDLREALKLIKIDQERIAETISRNSKMTKKQVTRTFRKDDTMLLPKQALKLGLIDEIKVIDVVDLDHLSQLEDSSTRSDADTLGS